jgi:hypothetical protein
MPGERTVPGPAAEADLLCVEAMSDVAVTHPLRSKILTPKA